jgi:hypothetical protein
MKRTLIILPLILGCVFFSITSPNVIVFNNDTPLGVVSKNSMQGAFVADWNDLNFLGKRGDSQGGAPASFNTFAALLHAPRIMFFCWAITFWSILVSSRGFMWIPFLITLIYSVLGICAIDTNFIVPLAATAYGTLLPSLFGGIYWMDVPHEKDKPTTGIGQSFGKR